MVEGGSGGGEVVVRMREGIQGRTGTRVLRWDPLMMTMIMMMMTMVMMTKVSIIMMTRMTIMTQKITIPGIG